MQEKYSDEAAFRQWMMEYAQRHSVTDGDGESVPLQPKNGIQMEETMGRDEGEPTGSVASTEENTANSQ